MIQPIKKIAVPVDFSSFSKAAVSYAAVLAKSLNAAMALINVILTIKEKSKWRKKSWR